MMSTSTKMTIGAVSIGVVTLAIFIGVNAQNKKKAKKAKPKVNTNITTPTPLLYDDSTIKSLLDGNPASSNKGSSTTTEQPTAEEYKTSFKGYFGNMFGFNWS